jgi:hypothetical protein
MWKVLIYVIFPGVGTQANEVGTFVPPLLSVYIYIYAAKNHACFPSEDSSLGVLGYYINSRIEKSHNFIYGARS